MIVLKYTLEGMDDRMFH